MHLRDINVETSPGRDAVRRALRQAVALIGLTSASLGCLQACDSTTKPSFITGNGVEVYVNSVYGGFTVSRCTSMEDALVSRLVSNTFWEEQQIRKTLYNATVELTPTVWQDGYSTLAGQQNGDVLSVADYPNSCPWKSSYMHEEAHLILSKISGDPDPQHSRASVWDSVSYEMYNHDCLAE